MKVSKQQVEQNRTAFLQAAARLYRERGVGGVGLADIARTAGLTHGGLYRHFTSKEDMAAQAYATAFEWTLSNLDASLATQPMRPSAIARAYLCEAHRDDPGNGCPVAAMAVDAAREGGDVAQAFATGVERYLELFTKHLTDEGGALPKSDRSRARAIDLVTQLVGALVLARATQEAAPELSMDILREAAASIARRLDPE